jgi:hypothetical protein
LQGINLIHANPLSEVTAPCLNEQPHLNGPI